MSIASPEDGATVESPVGVSMEADGFTIEPAGEVRDGAGHLHLMVDTGCVAPGETIPEDANHLHFGDGSTETELDLPPGEHTLCLQAGDGAHTALDVTDEITIIVVRPDGVGGEMGAEEWEGTYSGIVDFGGGARNEFSGEYVIVVDEMGSATMTGTGTNTYIQPGSASATTTGGLSITGERSASGFDFSGPPNGTPFHGPGYIPFTINVTGNSGTGHYSGPTYGGAPGTVDIDFEVECRSC